MTDVSIYFQKIKQTSQGFKALCPWCGNTDWTFSWNTEKEVGCCFHQSCPIYYKRGGVRLPRLLGFFNIRGIEQRIPDVIQTSETADVKLPEEFKLIDELDKSLGKTLLSYFSSRGIHKKVVRRAKVGYVQSGKMWGYLVFPVFDNGEVLWWQGRRFKDRKPKFYNPTSSKKGELVYRVGRATKPGRIVLVESIFNALTLEPIYDKTSTGDLIIGLLGKTLSEIQMDKILAYEKWCQEIVVALDPDAIRDACDIAAKFTGIIPSVKVPVFPEGSDVNSLGVEKAWKVIRNSEQYDERHRQKFLNNAALLSE